MIPYDWEAIKRSVKRTNRVVFVNEDTEVTNFGEHLLRRVVEELFSPRLHAPPPGPRREEDLPGIGLAENLEHASVPQLGDITRLLREVARHQP